MNLNKNLLEHSSHMKKNQDIQPLQPLDCWTIITALKSLLMLVGENDLQDLLLKNEHSLMNNSAILLMKRPRKLKAENLFWLSENGDLNEISKISTIS